MLMVAHRTGGRIRWNVDVPPIPNILSEMPPRERCHPNEKPLKLMRRIVEAHTLPGDVVLDPFMGSGTTGVAALGLGRKFIGIELDESHFETACRRIEASTKQADLFQGLTAKPAAQTGFFGEEAA